MKGIKRPKPTVLPPECLVPTEPADWPYCLTRDEPYFLARPSDRPDGTFPTGSRAQMLDEDIEGYTRVRHETGVCAFIRRDSLRQAL